MEKNNIPIEWQQNQGGPLPLYSAAYVSISKYIIMFHIEYMKLFVACTVHTANLFYSYCSLQSQYLLIVLRIMNIILKYMAYMDKK